MHKVEIRLTNEGNEDAANVFEVYNETLGDKGYEETAKQEVSGGGAPVVMFLELNERVIIVAKGNAGRLVFDKEQNANVRVETEEEKKYRAEREERSAKQQADKAVEAAKARVQEAQDAAARAEHEANGDVKRAEADRAKIEAEHVKNRPAGSNVTASGVVPKPGTQAVLPNVPRAGNATSGPVDSKQVKS